MNPTTPDPVIDEIREIRHRISADCDHDPAKLVAYLMEYQKQFRDRLTYDPADASDAQPVHVQALVADESGKGDIPLLRAHPGYPEK